ncbi:MAG: uspA [Chloroflexi bacterium]|jgi:nucleotide-binding universal stress UspA family protein|nr:uspA [Chloroflexota bacterium]
MRKILLAYDGGEPARRALQTAGDLALTLGASLSVVSVVPVCPDHPEAADPAAIAEHARDLQEAKRLLAERGIEVELLEPTGDPAGTIERIADEGGFDTIVLGSRGLGTIGRMLKGSISEHVVSHARATVVVTH